LPSGENVAAASFAGPEMIPGANTCGCGGEALATARAPVRSPMTPIAKETGCRLMSWPRMSGFRENRINALAPVEYLAAIAHQRHRTSQQDLVGCRDAVHEGGATGPSSRAGTQLHLDRAAMADDGDALDRGIVRGTARALASPHDGYQSQAGIESDYRHFLSARRTDLPR